MATPTINVPRSQSVPHITFIPSTKITTATSPTEQPERHPRPYLLRHRSAIAISGTHLVPKPVITPRVERDDPFSLSGFFPHYFADPNSATNEQQWDWVRAEDEGDHDAEDVESEYRSGCVTPFSESDDEWSIPTPCTLDTEDALTGDAIKREDKLGILTLSNTLFLQPRGDELYVEDRLLSPFVHAGDPLEADAVYDALRALRTAHSLPYGSAVKDGSAALHGLFSPENEVEDKVQVEAADGLWALVSWGVSRVVDYLSPV